MERNGTATPPTPLAAVAAQVASLKALAVVFVVVLGSFIAATMLDLVDQRSAVICGLVVNAAIGVTALVARRTIGFTENVAGGSDGFSDEAVRLARYNALLDALPQPILLLDADDRVVLTNATADSLLGLTSEAQPLTSIIRAPAALDVLREARHSGQPHEGEFSLSAPTPMTALFYAAPLNREESQRQGEMIVMLRDRTEQKKLERMRTDFLANAGHELRTPLASILGFIETLQGHAKDDPEAQGRFLKIMQAQTERMLRLVRDLVSLSTLELNERRLPEEAVDLCEVAQVTREMMAPVVEANGGNVIPGPADCSAPIKGDRDQLMQVFQNLIDNALRYGTKGEGDPAKLHITVGFGPGTAFVDADKGGDSPYQVAVRSGCEASELRYLRVRDEGHGIDPTDLPRITERFYRIDVERSRTNDGTGLGLAIVKHIVGRHRGGILIESKPGEGAAFTCYFPPFEDDQLDKDDLNV